VVFALTGRHQDALEQFERHLKIARELGDRYGETTATGRAGAMHFTIGNVGKSIEYTQKSLALSGTVDRERHAIDMGNLGEMFRMVGQPKIASKYLDDAQAQFHSIGSRRFEAGRMGGRAQVFEDCGDQPNAERMFRSSLELYRQVGDRRGEARTLIHLGRLRRVAGDTEGARGLLENARAIAVQIEAPELSAWAATQAALLPGGEVEDAREAIRRHGPRLEVSQQLDALLAIWQAGGGTEDLAMAHETLMRVQDQTPEEYRESMIENVPIHKAITEAWEAQQR
jgi:tetratricopeptide (TPR) repeat protein